MKFGGDRQFYDGFLDLSPGDVANPATEVEFSKFFEKESGPNCIATHGST